MVCRMRDGDLSTRQRTLRWRGFTLVELLVVLAIMATLLAIVAPRYFDSVDKAKEAALKTNLRTVRDAIDKYHADSGRYPVDLNELVVGRYIRDKPYDPISESDDSWVLTPPPEGGDQGVFDVHSSAQGLGRNGVPFQNW
jgi:general secretion pathway protein G